MEAKFDLVMPGLRCSRAFTKLFKLYPEKTNAKVIDEIFTDTSMNYSIKVQSTMFRFQIERLPSSILPEKTRVIVNNFVNFVKTSFSS